ncbi:MAG: hypothetical protein R2877_01505 [Bdellovibrionota bacterium]
MIFVSGLSFGQTQKLVIPTCNGVTPGLNSQGCVMLSSDSSQLMCNSTDKDLTLINSLGWLTGVIPASRCDVIYDANRETDRTNEKRTMERFTFQPFHIDPDLIVKNPHNPSASVKDSSGVIAIKAISLMRNWETDDVDEGGSESTFDVFGMWVMPGDYLQEQVDANELDFQVWGNLFNSQLIYDPNYEEQREALSDLLRNKISKTKYPELKITGPYLNIKSGIHKYLDKAKGNEPRECEWVGCDQIGPQVLVYDKTYGIAQWSDFEKMKDDDTLIFIAKAGDAMAMKDDIILYFQVPVGLLRREKESYIFKKIQKTEPIWF